MVACKVEKNTSSKDRDVIGYGSADTKAGRRSYPAHLHER